MKVITEADEEIALGTTETTPTIGIVDYSRRETDDFGVTTVVERGFARRLSVRLALSTADVDVVQTRLAELRAAPARWIADDRFAWLDVAGFYKDFELDLATGSISYCTLTVEGLAETEVVADVGGDPAPIGSSSTLRLLQPVAVTDAVLTSSNVPETDHAEWAAGTTYALGARVIKASAHRIYESAASGNIGHDPAAKTGHWVDVGPTNRWAMFDQALGSLTTRASSIAVTLAPGAVNALALLDVTGTSVRVQATGYDQTKAVAAGSVKFLDLPATGGSITITVTGAGSVSVGTLLVGYLVSLGITETSPTAAITDFSRKDVDDFGEVSVVERAWSKRMTARALIRSDAVDVVANRVASVRARPSLWIGDEDRDSLTVYGFFRDFSLEVGQGVSLLSLSVEGLSKAPPLGGPTFGQDGEDGLSIAEVTVYQRKAGSAPAVPIGGSYDFAAKALTPPAGWAALPPAGTDPLYAAKATVSVQGLTGSVIPTWTGVGKIAEDGAAGLSIAEVAVYQRKAGSAPAVPTGGSYDFATKALTPPAGWSILPPAGTDPLYAAKATASIQGVTGSAAPSWAGVGKIAEDGAKGADGAGVDVIFIRSAAQPATPAASAGIPAGWYSDVASVPASTNPLWSSFGQRPNSTSNYTWDTAARVEGAAGPAIVLTPSAGAVTYQNGVSTGSQTITITATLQNVSGAVTWSTVPAGVGTAGTTTYSLNDTHFASRSAVVVMATVGAVSKSVTITRQDTLSAEYLTTINYNVQNAKDASNTLLNISADGTISKKEKTRFVIPMWNTVQSNYVKYRAEGVARAVSVAAFDAAYNGLNTYIAGYSSMLDVTCATEATNDFNNYVANYYKEEAALVAACNAKAATTAKWSLTENDNGKRPENGATSSDNLVQNPNIAEGSAPWLTSPGATLVGPGPGNPVPWWFRIGDHVNSSVTPNGGIPIPAAGGQRLFWSMWMNPSALNNTIYLQLVQYNADGSVFSTSAIDLTFGFPGGAWVLRRGSTVLSSSCHSFVLRTYAWLGSGGGTVLVGGFRFAWTEAAATVGGVVGDNIRLPDGTVPPQRRLDNFDFRLNGGGDGVLYAAVQNPSTGTWENIDQVPFNDIGASAAGISETASRKWAAESGADVTATKPIVSRLHQGNGRALGNFTDENGMGFSRVPRIGSARNGDAVSFGSSYPTVPTIVPLYGGNAPTAGRNIVVQAQNTTVSGFIMRAVDQAVTAGTTYTDGPGVAGGAGEPTLVINRSNGAAPFNGQFTFSVTVLVGSVSGGAGEPSQPGYISIGLYCKQGGAWVQVSAADSSTNATLSVAVATTADFGAGNEFGVSVLSAEGAGTSLQSLNSVSYTGGTVTETSLTPAGTSSPIQYLAVLP